ncbi:hypothetical protein DUNSADRAFT_1920 [Dunaliella salina]|uniref:Peptidase A1 domain-containing protein n=1 Tax=Dunaliella salina TaxID=3046 RepID=A0ABQ7FWW2_DUNSA|nr:hypothetical protein DUNSADRAFT_1920 [Dunaliella salina]|eukprot:KAF5826841.1 hypothetical protein DUNSADRAFT_1920 [Dunaliella salina]
MRISLTASCANLTAQNFNCPSYPCKRALLQLNNTVHVCTSTWVVQSLQQPLSGDLETWLFGTWRPWTADMRVLYPSDLIHQATAGGRHVYKVWRSISGHLLVRPLINGKDSGGYMILDTGASGFVITQSAAIALGLASFGELYAASISGKVGQ